MPILGNGRLHDGHQIDEVVVEENIYPNNEAAGIVNESNDEDFVFLPVRKPQIRANTGVTAPDLIDVRAFIAAHIRIAGGLHFNGKKSDIACDGGFGYFTIADAPIIFQLPEDGCCLHAGIIRF